MNVKLYAISLLCIAIAIVLLWLNTLFNWHGDWTFHSRNTLNTTSIDLLDHMQEPIKLFAFFDSNNQTRLQVRRLVEKYQRFKKDISLEFIDNQLSTEQLQELGFTQFGQLKVQYQDKTVFINRLSEQEITRALFQAARKQDTWIAMIEGHGERDPFDQGNNGLSKLVNEVSKTGIKFQSINLLSQGVIPDNTQALIIAGPRNAYLGSELKLIEDYLASGGNLLWLRDPAKQNYFASLDAIFGIKPIPGVVIDANTKLRILLGVKHAAVIPVTEFYKHDITQELDSHLLFPFASAIEVSDNTQWQKSILFRSLDRSWSEVGELNTDTLKYDETLGDSQGPLTLGLSLTRKVSDNIQRVIIIGDSDFIANGYIGYGANFALSLNLLNWLAGDDKLISIAHQSAPDQSIELNDQDVMYIALILLVIAPGLLIATGFTIRWWRHQH